VTELNEAIELSLGFNPYESSIESLRSSSRASSYVARSHDDDARTSEDEDSSDEDSADASSVFTDSTFEPSVPNRQFRWRKRLQVQKVWQSRRRYKAVGMTHGREGGGSSLPDLGIYKKKDSKAALKVRV
jgi:hypothetical protein